MCDLECGQIRMLRPESRDYVEEGSLRVICADTPLLMSMVNKSVTGFATLRRDLKNSQDTQIKKMAYL